LKANANSETDPHLFVIFDYADVPLKVSIKALTPLAFSHTREQRVYDEDEDENNDEDEYENDDEVEYENEDEDEYENNDDDEDENGDDGEDGSSDDDQEGSDESYSDEEFDQNSLDVHEEEISEEWHGALREGGETMVAVRVIVPRGEVPQVMTALLRPIELEDDLTDNDHSLGDDHISGEEEEKWVGVCWIHST